MIKSTLYDELLKDLDSHELLDAGRELSEKSLKNYAEVFQILLLYPEEIYKTINEDMAWKNVLSSIEPEFCTKYLLRLEAPFI